MKWHVQRAVCEPALARRTRLAGAVAALAIGIERGECTPLPVELEALAQLCEEQWLPSEAARVRRWMNP